MEWEHPFPEPIESIEDSTDANALQTFVDGARAAGEERTAAWTAGTAATDAELDEAEAFAAAVALATERIAALEAAETARAARVAKLGFKPTQAPPPGPGAPEPVDPEPEDPEPESRFSIQPEIVTTVALPSFAEGQKLTSLREQGLALIERAKRVKGSNSGERFGVMQIRNYIPENLMLPEAAMAAFGFLQDDKFDDDGLVAGFCAPPETDYSFCGGSSDLRPVLGALRRYGAPRGRVTKMATPLFSAVGTGSGQIDDTGINQWTNDDDDADPFVEKLCSVLNCVGDETFSVYSTYKCVTIKNFMALAFPEWVGFNMMQLDALWARFAEILLLDQIFARAGAAITTTTTYGALPTVLTRINQLLNNYTENERYESTPGLLGIAPRWLRSQLKNDAIRQGKTLSNGDIDSALASIGIGRMVWTMDNPTVVGDYVLQGKGAALVDYPANAELIVTRPDNLRVLDIGATDIGITTEKEYRDTTTNVRNEYQVFVESFEGLIDMGCPTWRFTLPICANGSIAPTSGYDLAPCGTMSVGGG